MHNAGAVRTLKGVGDIAADGDQLFQRQRSAFEPLFERLPLQKLHHQVVGALLVPDVIQGANIGMIQLRNRLGFTLES